jgi:lysophospholipase L1-like esterase
MAAFTRPAVLKLLLWGALALVLWAGGRTAWRVQQSIGLARQSEPLEHAPEHATVRLLIVGDSTAVGTGASGPEASVAGLLAQAFPHLQIDNRARDGATFAQVPDQLGGDQRFDMVLVMAGGNDVVRLRDLDALREDVHRVVRLALERGDRVVLMPAGNVGNAPFFFPPVSWLMTWRSRRLHTIVNAVAAPPGVVVVNLFRERADDPFVRQPRLNARDGLHPADAGYRVWFDELMAQAALAQRFAAALPVNNGTARREATVPR